MNSITVIGNVGGDPELRYTKSGMAQVKFSVATSFNKKNGEKETTWHRCVAWGDTAEAIASEVTKGDRVFVIGRHSSSEYTAKNGEQKTTQEIAVDDCGKSLRFGAPKERSKFSAPKQAEQMSFDEEEPF